MSRRKNTPKEVGYIAPSEQSEFQDLLAYIATLPLSEREALVRGTEREVVHAQRELTAREAMRELNAQFGPSALSQLNCRVNRF